jgi:hypothetical protein
MPTGILREKAKQRLVIVGLRWLSNYIKHPALGPFQRTGELSIEDIGGEASNIGARSDEAIHLAIVDEPAIGTVATAPVNAVHRVRCRR